MTQYLLQDSTVLSTMCSSHQSQSIKMTPISLPHSRHISSHDHDQYLAYGYSTTPPPPPPTPASGPVVRASEDCNSRKSRAGRSKEIQVTSAESITPQPTKDPASHSFVGTSAFLQGPSHPQILLPDSPDRACSRTLNPEVSTPRSASGLHFFGGGSSHLRSSGNMNETSTGRESAGLHECTPVSSKADFSGHCTMFEDLEKQLEAFDGVKGAYLLDRYKMLGAEQRKYGGTNPPVVI